MAKTVEAGGVIKCTAAADATTDRIVIKKIRWVGVTTAAHELLLKDTAGNEIYSVKAQAANDNIESDFDNLQVHGLVVTTMGSGTLYIYG